MSPSACPVPAFPIVVFACLPFNVCTETSSDLWERRSVQEVPAVTAAVNPPGFLPTRGPRPLPLLILPAAVALRPRLARKNQLVWSACTKTNACGVPIRPTVGEIAWTCRTFSAIPTCAGPPCSTNRAPPVLCRRARSWAM